jgi:hypothetical protein
VFLYITLQAGVNFDWWGFLVRHVLKGENVETKRPKPSKRKGQPDCKVWPVQGRAEILAEFLSVHFQENPTKSAYF